MNQPFTAPTESHLACIDDNEWDNFLKNCSYCHHEQSSQFAANRQSYGYHCDRVVVRNRDGIVGGAQILVQTTPLGRFAHIQRGPVAIDDDLQVMRQVLCNLEAAAKQNAYRSLRVDLFTHQTTAFKALEAAGFACCDLWSKAMRSVSVPLNFSDDELLAKMHKKVAYEVRRADKRGVRVLAGGAELVDEFYDLHQGSASYQEFPIFPREYFVYLWQTFGSTGRVQLFIAYCDGKPLAGLFNTIVGDHMYFGWGGMSREPEAKKLRVNYLLHMAAMTWAREHGCTRYDFAGTQPFKQWFALEIVQWPSALRKLYGPAKAWRWQLIRTSSNSPLIISFANKIICRLGFHQRMPV